MKERPILFNSPMVRAILDGRKTQTRRVVKHDLQRLGDGDWYAFDHKGINYRVNARHTTVAAWAHLLQFCPYGQPGERMWARETWAQPTTLDPGPTFYRADYPYCVPDHFQNVPAEEEIKWKPSIHMKRADSRILLEITAVRVERLTDISESDALAEGIKAISKDGRTIKYGIPDKDGLPGNDDDGWNWCNWMPDASIAYRQLWEQINGPGSWATNPWVWVIEFKQVQP